MQTFKSEIREVGALSFPAFSGARVMMMPFHLHDVEGTLPDSLAQWRAPLGALVAMSTVKEGVGYLTIDEAIVGDGETHRRPGLHVDGIGPDGGPGAWGGGGGWAKNGMLVAASRAGCRGWCKEFTGQPGANGDCTHLSDQCVDAEAFDMEQERVYWCGALAVHESIQIDAGPRQFVRVSMPSDAPWYEGYTRNPLGVEPTGTIHPARSVFMDFRAP